MNRVALFWSGLYGGGAERIMLILARGFIDRGVDIDIVLTTTEGELKNEVPDEARVINLGASRILLSLPGLVRYLRHEKPSVLLTALKPTNCVALWARTISNVRTNVVVTEHNTLSLAVRHSDKWIESVYPFVMSNTYPSAERIIAVSKGVRNDLADVIGLNKREIDVVYNPVIGENVLEKMEGKVDHKWFSEDEPPVIVGVGRLNKVKGFQTLLRAFERVNRDREARLVILGEGEQRRNLEELAVDLGIQEQLWMPGFVSNPLKYMARSSLFVLSSRREGLPTVLIEAMASGTPVVATNCESGPAEILGDGEYGCLIPVGNPSSMACGIVEALDGEVQAAPRSALDRFRQDAVVEQYLDILSQAA